MRDRSLNSILQRYLPKIVLILCLMQPVMDVLSYWLVHSGVGNTISLLLRFCVLAFMVLSGFSLSARKWIYIAMLAILLVLTGGHVAVCWHYGYNALIPDLTNLVRIYQFPLAALVFLTYLNRNESCMEAIERGFLGNLAIIILVEILATVTKTDPHTYANKGVGVLGWFAFANAQSAILCMIVPIAVAYVGQRKNLRLGYVLGAGVVGFGVLYLFGTRLSYAGLLGCAFGLAVSCLLIKAIKKVSAGKAAAVFAGLGAAAILLAGVSPMATNYELTSWNAEQKQVEIDALVAADTAAAKAAGLEGQELDLASLRGAYETYLPDVVARFGLERVAKRYDYSTSASDLGDWRMAKKTYNEFLLEDQPMARWFGLELEDLTFGDSSYDAENDFHGIYYLCGRVGLVLLLLSAAFVLIYILCALVKDLKGFFTLRTAGFGIALICGLAHAYFTAGVLRRPNANFYLAVAVAVLYHLAAMSLKRKDRGMEA